jgi:hypothetical protein
MSNTYTPVAPASPTAQVAIGPSRASYSWPIGTSATGSAENRVLIPNAQTRKVMAETEAGDNIVNFATLDELFSHLDS